MPTLRGCGGVGLHCHVFFEFCFNAKTQRRSFRTGNRTQRENDVGCRARRGELNRGRVVSPTHAVSKVDGL
jgi:hypothetical protein